MKKTISRERVLKKLEQLAFGRANDVVRLAMDEPELGLAAAGRLDLTLLSEIKRGASGSVEVKLVDRLAAIRLLLETLDDGEKERTEAEQFLAALVQTDGREAG